jgi:Rieske 2Fe-2S family protein
MSNLAHLLNEYRRGYGLPQSLYLDLALYQAEMDAVWRSGWLFAGHSVEAPSPGDYFVYDIDCDSVIIARAENGALAATHNVCRHRGSRIMNTSSGHARRFICPYHQWTYAPNGELMTCRGMPDELDKTEWGLKPVALREVQGLVFICLSDNPPDFQAAFDLMAPMALPQGFSRARVAHIADYQVPANWKIVWENNRECYHCEVNHPQYIKANFDRYDTDDLNEELQARIDAATLRSQAKWAQAGLASTSAHAGLFHFPDAEGKIWYSASRTALVDGYLSESMDGQLVAPLMGSYADPDVGTLRLRTLPNFWCHASCDHAVSTRLTPAGARQTNIRVTWLVDEKAEPKRDYQLDRLLPFWQLTSEQDWEICTNVQRGIESRAYIAGPLSPKKEYNVSSFLEWYIQRMVQFNKTASTVKE